MQLVLAKAAASITNLHEDEGVEDNRVGLSPCRCSVPYILVYATFIQGMELLVALAVSCAGSV